jgi:hypothetical protein
VADRRLLILAALAACGGPAAAPPVAPVDNEAPAVAELPDEEACRAAMEVEHADDVQLVVIPDRPVGVCVVTTSSAEDENVTIATAAIVRDGDRWVAIDAGLATHRFFDTEEMAASATARLELFELGPGEHGVLEETTALHNGQQYSDRGVYLTLYRVEPDGKSRVVLTLSSESSTGEADDVWERVVTRRDTLTEGFYDLEVAVSHQSAQWAAGDAGYTEERWTEVWYFDGAAYQLGETIEDETAAE